MQDVVTDLEALADGLRTKIARYAKLLVKPNLGRYTYQTIGESKTAHERELQEIEAEIREKKCPQS